MAAAAGKNGFDGRMFAKLAALLDSPQDAEAAGALHRMRLMLKKSGIAFYEAVESHDYKSGIWESFDEPECLRDYFERRGGGSEADRLRGQLAQLETRFADMQERLEQAEQDGAEIAARAETSTAKLRQEAESQRRLAEAEQRELRMENKRLREDNATLQEGFRKVELCRPCESKRRLLAVFAGGLMAAGWFHALPWSAAKPSGGALWSVGAMPWEGALPWQRYGGIGLAAVPILAVLLRWQILRFMRWCQWESVTDNNLYRSFAGRWNGLLGKLVIETRG